MMKQYLKDGLIYAFDNDGSQDNLIKSSMVRLSEAELAALRFPPKTQAQIDNDVSDTAKANLTKLRADIFPDILNFLATLPGAPLSIRNAAVLAATEKVKVKI